MTCRLPPFEPVGVNEGRAFWRQYRGNSDIERMLLEIAHARDVMREIEGYFESVQKVWIEENLGQLVAMEKIRLLLSEQSVRHRALAGLPPTPASAKRDGRRAGKVLNTPDEPEPALID